ncbi:MAG: AbrB family transcriptional regulator [Candidatus Bathyarchaeia archaeon]
MKLAKIVRLDSKGRILIPSSVRIGLGLSKGMYLMIYADLNEKEIRLTPFADPKAKLVNFKITILDTPGALAKVALILAKYGVDLLSSESRTLQRGKIAEWNAIGDISKCKLSFNELRDLLKKEALIKNIQFKKLS